MAFYKSSSIYLPNKFRIGVRQKAKIQAGIEVRVGEMVNIGLKVLLSSIEALLALFQVQNLAI